MQSEDGINVNKRECGTFYMIIIPPCKVQLGFGSLSGDRYYK
jgi:hypothetical protein